MHWDRDGIVKELLRLRRGGTSLAYSSLSRRSQSLLSAAAYHFGSYHKALEAAGIDYSQELQRPRWTKARIIGLLKKAKRDGEDLHWSAVTKRGDELSRAAFASLQSRLFGSWVRALHAAGLDADEVARYRTWDRNTVSFELRSRHQNGDALASGSLQKDDAGLHAAAIRYFGSYDDALRAAKLNPKSHRLRKRWSRNEVVKGLKQAARDGVRVSDTSIRRHNSALYGAAVRIFGCFTDARSACGLTIGETKKAKIKR